MNDLHAFDVRTENHVAEVVLKGPGKGNAMGPEFWAECPKVFRALDRDPEVRAVVVRGSGGEFSFGLDLKQMMGTLGEHFAQAGLAASRSRLLAMIGELQQAFDAIENCRKPVLAAIAGRCIGGGIDMISACDARFASANALFSVREARLAIVADMGSLQRLPRIIGHGNTRQLAFTGEDFASERALRIGLVNDVLPDEAALLEHTREVARKIAENSPLVVQGIKQVLDFCEGKSIKDGERFVAVWNAAFLASEDLMEATAAFVQKRAPVFTGK